MIEKIQDTIVNLLLEGIQKKIASVKEGCKWQKLFVDTGKFFLSNPEVLVKFEEDLYLVFSSENLGKIANKLKDINGYNFHKILHKELYDLMMSYEIPINKAETYIHKFMEVIITYLEENYPSKTMEMFLGNMREEVENHFTTLESKMDLVLNKILELNKEKITTYSITDIDEQIRREAKYKRMGIDFFKLDDEQFESNFQNVINDIRVYVVGKSREETIYRILNELKNKNSNRVTLIIKSEKEWKKLQKTNLSGNILIPFFYADKIVAIPNNTNIFVYGEDEPCSAQNKLVLRKRTKRNIINSLEEIGIDTNEAYKMVDNTHGLYVPLKKKLFNGAMYDKPDWVQSHSETVMAALLCGKWTEATGDVSVFEKLSGRKYADCKKELEKYLHRENPYIVLNNSYGGSNIQLASVEDAWEELDIYINDDIWDKFINIFYDVLIESEPIFEYPFEKHFEASIYAKKPEWSPALKEGMIRTLIMRAYYRGHEENQRQIDNIVSRILDNVTSKEAWGYISQYLVELCEASPKSVLRKLEMEMDTPQGLLELFSEDGSNFVTSRYYYINVLWAVEQLIQQKKYVTRALEWLWKMDSYNIKYNISNSPRGILDVVFCAWINKSALSVEGKIKLARNAIERYSNAWEIIASKLPKATGSICSTLNLPKYRKVDEPEILYMYEINKTYIEYLKMCVDKAHTDADRWIKILQCINRYEGSIRKEVFEELVIKCKEMNDEEKIRVKNKIRYEIFRNRYFVDEDWSMSEEILCEYECRMNEIIVDEKIYDFLYIFSHKYAFPLLNPIPNSKEGTDIHDKNYILREKEIKARLKEFNEKGYSIDRLIQLAVQEKYEIVGEVFAQFYCNGSFNGKVLCSLIKNDEEGKSVYDYVSYIYRNGIIDLRKVVEQVKSISENKNLLTNLISLEIIDDCENALIASEDEDIKKRYWSKSVRLKISDKAEHRVFVWAIRECQKYGSFHTYLEFLYEIKDKISVQELYKATLEISDIKNNVVNSMTDYYLKGIFDILQKYFIEDDKKCTELATLEWFFRELLEWENMKCMQKIMKDDPTFYASLVSIIYKMDGCEAVDEAKRKLADKVYSWFNEAKFCPTEKNGKVTYENLKRWIEKFRNLLTSQKQEKLFGNLIGCLLAYSPIGEDGYSPCEAVRMIIEEYYTDSLKTSYVMEEENKRGIHIVDAGKSELILYQRYKENAEVLQEQYPYTAEIYFEISDNYKCEAKYERKCAEDEW